MFWHRHHASQWSGVTVHFQEQLDRSMISFPLDLDHHLDVQANLKACPLQAAIANLFAMERYHNEW